MSRRSMTRLGAAVLALGVGAIPALATYSVILIDYNTKEIALGSCTCVPQIDLEKDTPVVVVGVGAATAQSQVDTSGQNRMRIWNRLQLGTDPSDILDILKNHDTAHQRRQYGIVDTRGRAVTFSGVQNGNFKNGVTGKIGTIVYAIQGNVLTGQPVIDAAEQAVLNTPGDLAEKVMAAMEAAHRMGGDGRCSCSETDPDGCGSPPPTFDPNTDKSAHVGYLIVSRRGDTDGVCDRTSGCANGEYYLNNDVANRRPAGPEPTRRLRELLEMSRMDLIGVPDQVRSVFEVTPNRLPNDGQSTAAVHIQILDWQGLPATNVENVEIMHDPDQGVGSSTIGALTLVDADAQMYEAELTAGTTSRLDHIAVRVTFNGGMQRYLMPSARVALQDLRFDLNQDGVVDLRDLEIILAGFGANDSGDLDGDGDTDISDLGSMLTVPGLVLPSDS